MIFDLQAAEDPRDIVHHCVQALVEGQVVGVPTETVYGLAANALDAAAVERLCEIKGRDTDTPLAISVRSTEAAGDYFCQLSALARRLSLRCWPGPLTLVVDCDQTRSATALLPESVQQRITGADGGIGFRVVDHRILSHIHRYLSAPLVLTSANRSGSSPPTIAQHVTAELGDAVPLLLDDGPTRYGEPSTVVRVVENNWNLLREGVVKRAAMNQFVKPVIAIVCTGNTCRSPMGETLLRELLRKKTNREDAIRVTSAGIAASRGCSASPQAVEVMGHRDLDLTGHSSNPLDESIINSADLILTMTRSHRAAILAAWPDMHDRVFTLRRDGGDVTDPVGMSVEVYQACADQIEVELAGWIESLDPAFFPQATDGNSATET